MVSMNSVTAHMNSIREFELQQAMHLFPPECRILEIGAGSGYQASKLKDQGFQVEAIDVFIDLERKVFEVRKYDGKKYHFRIIHLILCFLQMLWNTSMNWKNFKKKSKEC